MLRALTLLLLLLTASVEAQQLARQAAFFQKQAPAAPAEYAGFYPTNLPGGASATVWYEPSMGYATNAGVATLSNLTSLGPTLNLTRVQGTPYKSLNKLNGLDVLVIDNGAFMQNVAYTSPQPHEVFMVLAITNVGASGALLDSNNGGVASAYHYVMAYNPGGGGRLAMSASAAGEQNACFLRTNYFQVINARFNGVSSTIFTNNVQGLTVSVGANGCNGLRINDLQTAGTVSTWQVLACWFTFTNRVLTTTERSNAFWYCTNRFNLSP